MTRIGRGSFALGLTVAAALIATSIPSSAEPEASPVEWLRDGVWEPKVGSSVLFSWELAAGEAIEVDIREKGLDVHVEARSDSYEWFIDGPLGGFGVKRLTIVADTASSGELQVHANRRTGVGKFSIAVDQRVPSDQDRERATADNSYSRGELARQQADDADTSVWATARSHYDAAASGYRRSNTPRGEFLALYRLGTVERRLEEPDAELTTHRRAEVVAREAGLRYEEGLAARRLGWIHHTAGRYDEAAAAYQRALPLLDGIAAPKTVAYAWNRLARAHDLAGHLSDAHLGYRRALAGYRAVGDAQREARELINLGEIDLRLGRFTEALDGFREALRISKAIENQSYQAIVLTSMGTALRRLGRLTEARKHFEASYQLHLKATDPSNEDRSKRANTLIGLGLTALRSGELNKAESALRSALDLTRELGDHRSEGATLINLGEVFEARGKPIRARAEAVAALDVFNRLNDVQGRATAYFAMARAERDRGQIKIAAELQELAIGHIEQIRAATSVDVLHGAYGAWKQEYYELLIELYLALDAEHPKDGWRPRAFETVERARSNSLIEAVGAWRRKPPSDKQALEIDKMERQWLDAAEALYRSMQTQTDEETLALRRRRVETLDLELASARQGLKVDESGTGRRLDLATARTLLGPDTLLLEIFLGQSSSWLWVVGQHVLEAHPMPRRGQLEDLAIRTHRAIQSDWQGVGTDQVDTLLADASRLVLGPAAEQLRSNRLVVVAPGALQLLPFAALPDPRDPSMPLVHAHRIIHLPSSSLLALLREPRRDSPSSLAVLADPITSLDDERWPVEGPSADPRRALYGPFPRLEATRREGMDLLQRESIKERHAGLGANATRSWLFGPEVSNAQFVHIAAHAFVETQLAGLAGLVLSPSADVDDGLIFAHELYDLDLAADLVVLSACRTALGESHYGEGLGSLTHAILSAGAQRAVVSLWNINDNSTADFMRQFYDALLETPAVSSEALRRTQLSFAKSADYAHPRFWAGFVLQGDW